ncbi:MAG TPA: inorganic phosphate transporter [Candidatus Acidoferrales bacterium]|nr:inorganic phosphate transporter [Candidatus Acidoferrales bacterium]
MRIDVLLVLTTIVVALIFDFVNGFHDSANSIATVVSTRVLSPKLAVLWAATFNFLAAFFLGTAVAQTIGSGMIHLEFVDQYVVLAGLFGAIVWDLFTWWWGLPTSSSHALIGGYAGAAMANAALHHRNASIFAVIIPHGWYRTLIFIVVAPVIGLILALFFMVSVSWIFRRSSPQPVDRLFRKLQLFSAAAYSLGHGANDAQKTMGIIAGALYTGGFMSKSDMLTGWGRLHWPIILAAHAAIAFGTYLGGWRIVKTMGQRITKLKPVGGCCAETAGAITLFGTALVGIPVSTTHTITGAIVGVGAVHRLSAVRWGIAGRIVWAWVLTIPAAALMAAAALAIMSWFT